MTRFRLDNRAARRVFLDRHALAETPQGPARGADLLALIDRLGFVQLDSINTVARAHDLILFSRRPRYCPEDLKRLYERDRALFEHWTHDASVIPVAFWSWWHLRRQRDSERLVERWKAWRQHEFEHRFQPVLDHIRDHGPVTSSDVGASERKGKAGGWWDWHPSKTALEYLWRSGALCVVGRDGFQKRYDLTERVLDTNQCDANHRPSVEETIDWCCNSALDRLGFATHGELAAFWAHITPAEAKAWCVDALGSGHIIPIEVESADGRWQQAYARPDLPEDPAVSTAATSRLRVLSPFDPALRDRKRAKRLFGFDYRIEIFVPEQQRKYGYYVFPILEGERVIGRIDMKAHRDKGVLLVRAMWPEKSVRWGKGKSKALIAELHRMSRLAGVERVEFVEDWMRSPIP